MEVALAQGKAAAVRALDELVVLLEHRYPDISDEVVFWLAVRLISFEACA